MFISNIHSANSVYYILYMLCTSKWCLLFVYFCICVFLCTFLSKCFCTCIPNVNNLFQMYCMTQWSRQFPPESDSQGIKLSAKEVSRVSRRVWGEVVVAINLERGTDLVDSDCADLSSHQIFIELLKVHFLSTTRYKHGTLFFISASTINIRNRLFKK